MNRDTKVEVEILSYTKLPLETVAKAALQCYSEKSAHKIENPKFGVLSDCNESKHHSVFEHASISFSIEGVSRALTHQLVRHRIASFSQQSQRYVEFSEGFDYITPPSVSRDNDVYSRYHTLMNEIKEFYEYAIDKGIKAEDARFATPQAAASKIVVTMNIRALMNFFAERRCSCAQWEIQIMAKAMADAVKESSELSKLLEYIPFTNKRCENLGYCPEKGARACGFMPTKIS